VSGRRRRRAVPGEEDLRALLTDYMGQDSFPDAARSLRTHLELLSDNADGILGADLSSAQSSHDDAAAFRLRQHLAFLRRCREDGLDRVFPSDSPYIDPTVMARIREPMAAADAAESRFDETSEPEALAQACAIWRDIAAHPDLAAAYPALRAALLNNAGGVLLRSVWAGGNEPDLTSAVSMLRHSVALTPPGSALLAGRLGNLGIAMRECYRRTSDPGALADALQTLRAAAAATTPGSPAQATARSNLALGLEELYLRDGDPAHLDEAIADCAQALRDAELSTQVRTDLLVQLGNTIRRRFAVRADRADLDRAVTFLEQAADATPPPAPQRPRRLVDLAIALLDRNARHGSPQDLARAISLCADAVGSAAPDSPDRPGCLVHLALGLYRRYEATGTIDDLDRAVELLDEAVRGSPRSVDTPAWAANLGAALRERARLHGAGAGADTDLHDAIRTLRGALSLSPADSPHRLAYLTNLANALRDRYQATGDASELDASIALLEQALGITGPRAADCGTLLANLGAALRDRYQRTHSPRDLERAVTLLHQASRSRGAGETDRPRRVAALALVLADRYTLTGDDRDRWAALAAFAEGCAQGLRDDPESTIEAASSWGDWASGQGWWEEAATAYGTAMTAQLATVGGQLIREHKDSWLHRGPGLGAKASYALAAVGSLPDAVQALEAGRGILLAEALDRDRADLGKLAATHGELAARYREAAQRVCVLERHALGREGNVPR
jgi:Tetratricopeptide repeat